MPYGLIFAYIIGNICMSAVAMSLRWANRGPLVLFVCFFLLINLFFFHFKNSGRRIFVTKIKNAHLLFSVERRQAATRKIVPYPFVRYQSEHCYERALLPSIICLGRLRIASKYIFNLWQLRQGVDSLAQWLEHWIFNREDQVRFPRQTWECFSAVLHSFVTAFVS